MKKKSFSERVSRVLGYAVGYYTIVASMPIVLILAPCKVANHFANEVAKLIIKP